MLVISGVLVLEYVLALEVASVCEALRTALVEASAINKDNFDDTKVAIISRNLQDRKYNGQMQKRQTIILNTLIFGIVNLLKSNVTHVIVGEV